MFQYFKTFFSTFPFVANSTLSRNFEEESQQRTRLCRVNSKNIFEGLKIFIKNFCIKFCDLQTEKGDWVAQVSWPLQLKSQCETYISACHRWTQEELRYSRLSFEHWRKNPGWFNLFTTRITETFPCFLNLWSRTAVNEGQKCFSNCVCFHSPVDFLLAWFVTCPIRFLLADLPNFTKAVAKSKIAQFLFFQTKNFLK